MCARSRNRLHARRIRLRKRTITESLRRSCVDLKEQNKLMREKIFARLGKDEIDDMVPVGTSCASEKLVLYVSRKLKIELSILIPLNSFVHSAEEK